MYLTVWYVNTYIQFSDVLCIHIPNFHKPPSGVGSVMLTIYLLTATNTKGFWPVKWDSTNSFNNKYLPIMPQRFHLPHHQVGRHEHQDKANKTVADKYSSGDDRVFSRCNVLLEVHFDVKGGCISTSTN